MAQELAIRLRGAVKRYGEITAVDGLDLDVPMGTCVGLLGPNGAGKSTTMRLLTAQSIADEGEIEVLGFRLPGESKMARAQCGVSPQLDNPDVELTCRQILAGFAAGNDSSTMAPGFIGQPLMVHARRIDRFASGRSLTDDLDRAVAREQFDEPGAHQVVVIGDQHPRQVR